MDNINSEKIKINLARLKKEGISFEINVNPDLAIIFKKKGEGDIKEILKVEQIFSDAKKGELASESDLMNIFKSTDPLIIAEKIIKEGEIQLTSEYRQQERDEKKRKIIGLIHHNAIDPGNGLPHPINRIELAWDEVRVVIDEHKTAEEQLDQIISKLRVVLPLRFEQSQMEITFPSVYAAKSYSIVQKNSKLLKEEWNSDGSWTVFVELPAGMKPAFIDQLNSLTHGEVIIKEK